MGVQAKFYVASITKYGGGSGHAQVKLQAVTRGGANAEWSSATPSGEMSMTITNPPAIAWFEDQLGKEVSITLDPWAVPQLGDGHEFVPMPGNSTYDKTACAACGCVHPAEDPDVRAAEAAELRAGFQARREEAVADVRAQAAAARERAARAG